MLPLTARLRTGWRFPTRLAFGGAGVEIKDGPQRGWYYDQATAIAVDSLGNTYLAGRASSSFPATPGPWAANSGSFVAKLNSNGNTVFATYAPGLVQGIALDTLHNNIFVTGQSIETSGPGKVMVAEFDPSGSQLLHLRPRADVTPSSPN